MKQIELIEDGEFIYLVSPLMNRGNVASFMKRRDVVFLTESELKKPMHRITTALGYIHAFGFIHNDI